MSTSGGSRRSSNGPRRGADVRVNVRITFDESVRGTTKKIDVTLKETIDQIKAFVEPMVDAINCNEKFMKTWKHDSKSWEEE